VPTDFSTVTEVTGYKVTQDQLERLYQRYAFAAQFCDGMDVLEVACGTGQGLGYLARKARRVVGGDFTEKLLKVSQRHYQGRVPLLRLDAHALPFRDRSFDVVILYEAIYYLADPDTFLNECRRVLRDEGQCLICTVNREWSDFNPSPYSTKYYSARELAELLRRHRFQVRLYGSFPATKDSLKDHVVSFLKRTAVSWNLIPKTMKGKEIIKYIFWGKLIPLPPEVIDGMAQSIRPTPISYDSLIPEFRVLYAVGRANE